MPNFEDHLATYVISLEAFQRIKFDARNIMNKFSHSKNIYPKDKSCSV